MKEVAEHIVIADIKTFTNPFKFKIENRREKCYHPTAWSIILESDPTTSDYVPVNVL